MPSMCYGAMYLASVLIVAASVIRLPALVLRPSLWFACAMLVQINGAVAFGADESFDAIANPALFRILLLLFPFLILAWVAATPRITELVCWLAAEAGRSHCDAPERSRLERLVLVGSLAVSTTIVTIYLMHVPLRSTGLYVMLSNPVEGMIAREMSLKLVDSGWIRYLYGAHCFVIAPIAGAMVVQTNVRLMSITGGLRLLILVLLLMSVMLTGARVAGGALIVVFGVVALLRVGILRGAKFLAGSVVGLLVIATLLTVQRSGQSDDLDAGLFLEYLSGAVLHRTVVVPLETGVWTNALAQAEGAFGVSSIRPLAVLFGEPYVNVANAVGLNYMLNPYSTVAAVTCTIFDYQAAFGYWAGWGVSLVLIFSLDYFLYCFAELRGRTLTAVFASFLVAELALISSTFTTVLLSHGMIPLAFIGLVLGVRGRYRAGC